MDDQLLARDGYSERPALLRAIALVLVAALVGFAGVPVYLPVLLGLAAARDFWLYTSRRRARLADAGSDSRR